ncbi:NADH-quinone oxidoreductase chain J [Ameyamaea chiangmaiensis NBRC 103196]|uniref:NADH-quinone oxidoreductase subunit J n=1 Tax=Ameyamaea chiangmaiensis TaxID=442969 RepID=A0A850P4E1_9PROT|nr:NADH-quinone oxidoreductase subunit J [Ameyamaea chiangmaiensis]MBS4074546.1 NADH-quinone oxidoreductase subunit J [Ameyamaea chiangmaiensis]NVN39507.1 NADH-quinone oxidoreductase subunit J [Ameyamaea chiangmaiensis]GBQ72435.1 NADH-quinone oxidoreductase chain J [Ameyamaea chiangmaiensis NBRC 103196]
MTALVFYVFATILVLSATMVISARNPVHSVLFLILGFFNAAGLFLLAGAEFLAMLLIIVYVGAVAVLFLFVVMMLDIRVSEAREGLQRYAPFGAAVGAVLFAELILAFGHWRIAPAIDAVPHLGQAAGETNTAALGDLIYTHYVLLFQACGLVLLVAMIGAIVLTLRERPTGRRQDIERQHARTVADTLELRRLPLGRSVRELGGFARPTSYSEAAAKGSYDPHAPVLSDESRGE